MRWIQTTYQKAIAALDAEHHTAPPSERDTTTWVLILASVLLTAHYYFARPGFFRASLSSLGNLWSAWFGIDYAGLAPYAYWGGMSVVLRIIIPVGFILFVMRQKPRDFGFRRWTPGHGKYYLGMYIAMLPVLLGASWMTSFQQKYPFYREALSSPLVFGLYEFFYGLQFIALEAFFRGFLLFALFRRFGHHAIPIMTIPYCMIHFGKPWPESFAAIIAGLLLGWFALVSRSWWPGALLHWSIGITMDVLCWWQTKLP